jgi:hypothetical protein
MKLSVLQKRLDAYFKKFGDIDCYFDLGPISEFLYEIELKPANNTTDEREVETVLLFECMVDEVCGKEQ